MNRSLSPNLKKRSDLLPLGLKNLSDLLPVPARKNSSVKNRVNGKIQEPEVSVIGSGGQSLGILSLAEALRLAAAENVDLVEIDRHAQPPICRMVDFGKFRYERSKRTSAKK